MILLNRKWPDPGTWLGAAALLAVLAAPALAQSPPPVAPPGEPTDGRYSMTPVANGFLRLDTRTGQTSLCTVSGDQSQCRAGADERAALEAEIARLTRENSELKAQAQAHASSGNPAPSTAQDEEDRRFDRNMDRAETFMRRMFRLFRDSQDKPASPSL
jgi:transcriptional regulator of met regulon